MSPPLQLTRARRNIFGAGIRQACLERSLNCRYGGSLSVVEPCKKNGRWVGLRHKDVEERIGLGPVRADRRQRNWYGDGRGSASDAKIDQAGANPRLFPSGPCGAERHTIDGNGVLDAMLLLIQYGQDERRRIPAGRAPGRACIGFCLGQFALAEVDHAKGKPVAG